MNRQPPACKADALPIELPPRSQRSSLKLQHQLPAIGSQWARPALTVGLGRVELPTSPLSGARSSQLSYRPHHDERLKPSYGRLFRRQTGRLFSPVSKRRPRHALPPLIGWFAHKTKLPKTKDSILVSQNWPVARERACMRSPAPSDPPRRRHQPPKRWQG